MSTIPSIEIPAETLAALRACAWLRAELARPERPGQVVLSLTRAELLLLAGRLNEAIEAVEDWEFPLRLGVGKPAARALRSELASLIAGLPPGHGEPDDAGTGPEHPMDVTVAREPGDVPSPAVVAAWERLGILRTERVPLWAAHWIVAGHDGEQLVCLAGLHGDDPRDVHDALPGALADCGVRWPESDAAAAAVAFTHLARLHLAGQAGALRVAQEAEEIARAAGYSADVLALPLGQVEGIADAWGAGWAGTDEQLAATVRAACAEQLAAGLQ